jgi:hypothetical protein
MGKHRARKSAGCPLVSQPPSIGPVPRKCVVWNKSDAENRRIAAETRIGAVFAAIEPERVGKACWRRP